MVESRARGGEGGGGGAGPDADRHGAAQEEPERSIWVKLADADVSEDWETVRDAMRPTSFRTRCCL